jgi:uncharacterized protein with HEPN domain
LSERLSHRRSIGDEDWYESGPELPLAIAYQMRNALAHGYFEVDYFEVDLETVWRTLETDLPRLLQQVRALTDSLPLTSTPEQ